MANIKRKRKIPKSWLTTFTRKRTRLTRSYQFDPRQFLLLFVTAGLVVILWASASGNTISVVLQSGAISGNAHVLQNPSYIGGSSVEFGPTSAASVAVNSGPGGTANYTPAPGHSATPVPGHPATPTSTPRTTPTPTDTCGNLSPAPANTEPSGSEAVAWAECGLHDLGAPVTSANVQTVTTWFLNEGTPHCTNNPLNLQTPEGGSSTCTSIGCPASCGLQNYTTPAYWGQAFAVELKNSSYSAMYSALMAGSGFLNSTNSTIKSELSVYSGGGYNSVPASYLNGQLGPGI